MPQMSEDPGEVDAPAQPQLDVCVAQAVYCFYLPSLRSLVLLMNKASTQMMMNISYGQYINAT